MTSINSDEEHRMQITVMLKRIVAKKIGINLV